MYFNYFKKQKKNKKFCLSILQNKKLNKNLENRANSNNKHYTSIRH